MANSRSICPKKYCTGCMACVNSCAHAAIEIQEDALGFRYPKINVEKCTDCGLCAANCPELNRLSLTFPLECHAMAIKDEQMLSACASGGAATAISLNIISKGGVVYGCCGKDIENVHHIRIDSIDEIVLLQGSKYVQSLISPSLLKEIRQDLLSGSHVVFIGTSCQVAGVKKFLRRDYDNLILVDLLCHGVSSQRMLNENIDYYRAQYPGFRAEDVHFREKNPSPPHQPHYGWFASVKDKPLYVEWERDPYMAGFMHCISLRECCYSCRYSYSARCSDITICDYWGLGADSELLTKNGVSAILSNTVKGISIVHELSELASLESRTIQEAVMGNGRLQCPTRIPSQRNEFLLHYPSKPLREAIDITLAAARRKARIKNVINKFLKFFQI